MKAFLMYRDRDFDPLQVLQRRDLHSRKMEPELDLRRLLPWNAEALIQDLELEILLKAMADDDSFLLEVGFVGLLSQLTEPEAIRYRQRVLRDCSNNEPVVRHMYRIAIEVIERERKDYWDYFSRYPSGTLYRAASVLHMFVDMLKALRSVADEHAEAFESEGFSRLFAVLRAELSDAYFATIEDHLRRLKFRNGVLISAALEAGNKGTGYVLRKPLHEPSWIERLLAPNPLSYRLHPRDESGARALSEIRDQGVNLVANALAQSAEHILSFFKMLRTELAFYIGCLNLRRKLAKRGEPASFPEPVPFGVRKLSFRGLYDVCLTLTTSKKVVGNDLDANGKDLIIITGANTGGKSTFLRSLGVAQLMMQAGMFVPAASFSGEVRDGLLTHFKREEDASMESGKLDEELSRMSEIVDKLTPRSMLLLNESFAATNEREGSEIASQITNALLERGVKVSFVTHLYSLAAGLCERKLKNAIFLRAERRDDGTRTFRMIEGKPLQTSYGKDVYDSVFSADRVRPAEQRRRPVNAVGR